MNKNIKNFANKFIPKTKEQIKDENEQRVKHEKYELYREQNQRTKILSEDIKHLTDKIIKTSYQQAPPQQSIDVPIQLNEKVETKIKLSDPLVVKNGKITVDVEKLTELIAQQNNNIIQTTVDKILMGRGFDNIYGGGAVGIKTTDFAGNTTKILNSVNDMIFTGDGVTITRKGKNVEVNIPGASVVAGDPTIDFARESSVLELYTSLQSVYTLLEAISSVGFITNYTDGIGGSTGYWQAY